MISKLQYIITIFSFSNLFGLVLPFFHKISIINNILSMSTGEMEVAASFSKGERTCQATH